MVPTACLTMSPVKLKPAQEAARILLARGPLAHWGAVRASRIMCSSGDFGRAQHVQLLLREVADVQALCPR